MVKPGLRDREWVNDMLDNSAAALDMGDRQASIAISLQVLARVLMWHVDATAQQS